MRLRTRKKRCVIRLANIEEERVKKLKRELWKLRSIGVVGEFHFDYYSGELFLTVGVDDLETVLKELPPRLRKEALVTEKGADSAVWQRVRFGRKRMDGVIRDG
ncbi:hypothetical protein Theam_1731 (plasmid) [Thermovibrio ammonificans HB-1]|uniref:Uncharacterized protein n=1 Tax=Thermovibrio ammonificans (strain DSM 15698 / JCM 12110 / HB-1) TaxID=648996 RepID=E8T6W6_THEA1|nr:hypothetical protein [Thermovibrio ammonificans]ADU97687.1 hypothetical protein Theam_1731 [Thermovibrio ammonificans HB-1]